MSSFRFVGIDVGSKFLDLCLLSSQTDSTSAFLKQFPNNPKGHLQLIQFLHSERKSSLVRIALEATGVYHLQIAFALEADSHFDLMVVNPRVSSNFARARNQRGKTDPKDARSLACFARDMPFVTWKPPSPVILQVRALTRRTFQLAEQKTQNINQLHALEASGIACQPLISSLQKMIAFIDEEMKSLENEAVELLKTDKNGYRKYTQLLSITGVGQRNGLRLWAELSVLDEEATVKQWVAFAGLDVVEQQSGKQIKRRRISKRGNRYIRNTLYMCAMVGGRYCEGMKSFKEDMKSKGKSAKESLVILSRKVLHSIYGMWKNGTMYDGSKLKRAKTKEEASHKVNLGALCQEIRMHDLCMT